MKAHSLGGSCAIRICQVTSCFPPSHGGLERAVFTLSQELVKRGYQVTVVTTSRGKADEKQAYHELMNGIRVIRYPETIHLLEAPVVPQIASRVLQEAFDILHVHGTTPGISDLAILCGKLKRRPVVVTYHYDPETPLFGSIGLAVARIYNHLSYIFLKSADALVATTKGYARTSPVLSRLLDRVKVIPLSINKDRFSILGSGHAHCKDHTKVDGKSGIILCVSQLREHKGLRYLLRAMTIIKARSGDARLVVVGDGPQRASLTKAASDLKLADVVSFAGKVTEDALLHYYAMANVVVLPSYTRRDAFGLVLLEAMAARKPIVASDIPGISEVVGGAGMLVPPRDAKSLAEAILLVLSGNESVQKMAWHAQENMHQYSWEHIVDCYERLYAEVLSSRRHQKMVCGVSHTSNP